MTLLALGAWFDYQRTNPLLLSYQGSRPKKVPFSKNRYLAVERHLKAGANDPESTFVERCTEIVMLPIGSWATTCLYRGKNAFAATLRQGVVVRLRPGTHEIVAVTPVEDEHDGQ